MAEYIEQGAFIRSLKENAIKKYPASFAEGILVAINHATTFPTANVVEVVRCKACGHSFWLTDERGRRMLCCTEIGKRGLSEDSFCSFGKASDV